jgi:tRNA pseudouridine38-40 synthase
VSPESRRVRLDLAYDGTDFAGWQVQPGVRTVQGVVSRALERVQGSGAVVLRGAGRTDAGVHARRQVADAQVATRLDDAGLMRALEGLLPADVRPIELRTVDAKFHSRFDARSKTYVYRLDRSEHGDPFLARYALHHPFAIDAGAVCRALDRLRGRHDWSAFAGSACDVEDRVRTLEEASFEESAEGVGTFTFTADGFLNHMVRNLVGTLLDVARGATSPERVEEILASRDRRRAGATAPARGLCLARVRYDRLPDPGA